MKILAKRQILMLHQHLVEETGGSPGLRDEGLLESALNAPFQSFGDTSAYPSLQQKAARLCYGLVKNHPFIDGNKRIGAHAMLVFLAVNGVELAYTQEELAEVILKLAAGENTYEDLLKWLSDHQL
ncbi:death-on-curing family protein [Pseudoflavonifractor capillosus ATCC 29799]|uniref:Death-on-curing family protein n=1 Tax=Pseudoflavonifractor capillosus ATCC 29799 TaxID=411467 RepID=A6P0F5_9FIRM|nr:type II toxin-antitoxin system death-on-curing family toxin [Pseudoflavonifractor capillosus]EDM98305.1 death-on-curing family protein [Pseudoflavonifractor capillosus ATCC 29799]